MTLKKSLLPTAGLIIASLAFPLSTFAAGPQVITTITGVVKDATNHVDSGVSVTETCNGFSHSTTTLSNGSYGFSIPESDGCVIGKTVSVTGTKGSQSGGGSASVNNLVTTDSLVINFAVVNFSVPEFSTTLGAIAGFLAIGTFFLMRKRNLHKVS